MYSSEEESPVKTRKPYTITKQRERWSDEEHNRFLEALKLHGRAWQRIEEHIGTKTAVQIRSHAQKFFTKLEKEALIKGVPLKETIDIDIPPPRPKKKPSNPYPRKTSAGTFSSSPEESRKGKLLKSDSSLYKQILDLETEPPLEKPDGTEKSTRAKEALDETDRSEVLTLFQEVPCTSISSVRKCSSPPIAFGKTRAFREFISSTKEGSNHSASDDYGSFLTLDLNANQKIDRNKENYANLDYSMSEVSNQDNCCHSSHEQLVNGEKTNGVQNQPEKLVRLTTDKIAADQDSTRNLPVHVVDVSSGINPESKINQQGAADGCSNLFTKPTSTASPQQYSNIPGSAIHQLLTGFSPPLTSICNSQDSSQMFSSLIMSALLQNPAAHAAATLAASLWPITNLNTSVGSPAGTTHPSSYMSPPQNMAAIAAATVAAASAWWAAHGFFPMCPSLHAGFTSVPASSTAVLASSTAVPAETGQAPLVNKEVEETISKNPPQENQLSESPEIQGLDSKGSPPSSSDSEESGDPSLEINLVESADQPPEPLPETAVHDSNKGKAREQVYRSSCGSNTASSSEVEATALEKQEEETKEESTKPDDNYLPSFDLNNHRTRFTGNNINESWKEVSSEGRMAFQALFSRERLPQSFLSQCDPWNTGELMNRENEVGSQEPYMKDGEIKPQLDLFGGKLWMDSSTPFNHGGMEKLDLLFNSCNTVKGFSPMRLGIAHGKLRGYRTGFKPYKRCSAEEGRVTAAEGKSAKRMRLEEETAASTR